MSRRIFTPAVIALVRCMAEQGNCSSRIAQVIGSTAQSVQVICSRHKIRLIRKQPQLAAARVSARS